MWRTYLSRPETDQHHSVALLTLGTALRESDSAAAMNMLEAANATLERFFPGSEGTTLAVLANLSSIYANNGRDADALRLDRVVFAGYQTMHGVNSEETIMMAENLCMTLWNNGLLAESRRLAREYLGRARRTLGDHHSVTIGTASRLAEALFRDSASPLEDLVEAEEILAGALKTAQRVHGPAHPMTRQLVDQLSDVRQLLQRRAQF